MHVLNGGFLRQLFPTLSFISNLVCMIQTYHDDENLDGLYPRRRQNSEELPKNYLQKWRDISHTTEREILLHKKRSRSYHPTGTDDLCEHGEGLGQNPLREKGIECLL